MSTPATHVGIWHSFAAELSTMPDVIERLTAVHRPTVDGRFCRACTTPGRGTPRVPWPCPLAVLARDAALMAPPGWLACLDRCGNETAERLPWSRDHPATSQLSRPGWRGSTLKGPLKEGPVSTPDNPSPPTAPPPKKRHTVRWIVLGVLALLVVLVAVFGATGGSPDTATTADPGGTSAPVQAPPTEPPAVVPAPTSPLTTFGNGTYLVGTDVAPGQYRSPGPEESIAPLCYWDLKDAGGTITDQGVAPEGPSRATLTEGLTFTSQGCQDWAKVG